MTDYAQVTAFLMAMGNMAGQRRPVKLAPGGVGTARPSPSKFRAQDGVTDSEFVGQIIQAAQQMGGGSMGLLSTGNGGQAMPPQGPMQPPQQGQQQPQQQGGPGDLLALLGAMGGGGR